MADQPIIKLRDGNMMPQLGLGVWQATIEEARNAALKALEVGYRSIDTAAIYKMRKASAGRCSRRMSHATIFS